METAESSIISDIDTALNDTLTPKGQKRKSEVNATNGNEEKATPHKKVVLNRNTPLITPSIRTSTDSKEGSDNTNGSSEEKKVIKLSSLTAKEVSESEWNRNDIWWGELIYPPKCTFWFF